MHSLEGSHDQDEEEDLFETDSFKRFVAKFEMPTLKPFTLSKGGFQSPRAQSSSGREAAQTPLSDQKQKTPPK